MFYFFHNQLQLLQPHTTLTSRIWLKRSMVLCGFLLVIIGIRILQKRIEPALRKPLSIAIHRICDTLWSPHSTPVHFCLRFLSLKYVFLYRTGYIFATTRDAAAQTDFLLCDTFSCKSASFQLTRTGRFRYDIDCLRKDDIGACGKSLVDVIANLLHPTRKTLMSVVPVRLGFPIILPFSPLMARRDNGTSIQCHNRL